MPSWFTALFWFQGVGDVEYVADEDFDESDVSDMEVCDYVVDKQAGRKFGHWTFMAVKFQIIIIL